MITQLKNERWKTAHKSEWRPNEIYQISSFGRVFSEKHKLRNLNFKLSNINGYDAFSVIKTNKKTGLIYVHKIVAELFIENPEQKPYVIHLDFNKANNDVNNLAWATRAEMFKHNQNNPLVIAGKEKRTRERSYSKLDVAKVKLIKQKLFDPNRKTKLKRIAKQFGISEMQLWRIKSGENWGDVTDY